MENNLGSHPEIKAAIVYGTKKFQSALLIEPVHPEMSREALLDEIWPAIKSANANCPAHARIMGKDFVTFVKTDKPLPRAGKGTVQRKMALKLYEEELDGLYETKTNSGATNAHDMNANDSTTNDSIDKGLDPSLLNTIMKVVSDIPGLENSSLSQDYFEIGMDSLGVISLTRALKSIFGYQNPQLKSITELMIYQHSSPAKLARALSNPYKDESQSQDEMQKEYERYVFDLPIVARPSTAVTGPKVFLLTGSTGSLGSYLTL